MECDASFHVFVDQVVLEERPESIETAPVAPLTNEQVLFRDVLAGILVHIEEAENKLVLETLTAGQKSVDNRLLATLETLVLHTVQKVENSSESMDSDEFSTFCKFLDVVIDNHGLITPMTAFVKSEQRKLETERVRIEDRCRHFLEMGISMDSCSVSVATGGSNRPPTDISNNKTTPRDYSIQHSQWGYGKKNGTTHNIRKPYP